MAATGAAEAAMTAATEEAATRTSGSTTGLNTDLKQTCELSEKLWTTSLDSITLYVTISTSREIKVIHSICFIRTKVIS